MSALDSKLRRDLERTIVEARNVVVAGVEAKLHELTVHEGKRGAHLTEDEAALRTRLRAHGRQIGDRRNSQSGAQGIDRLVQECAYEQWHRMIFVRFLAENEFLLDPEYGQAISMEDLIEIADESNDDPWELGGQFAAKLLPAIFRPDDSLLQVKLSQETLSQLERLLDRLPKRVFTADDSLGWVYQFWQSEEKERVNREGAKISGQTMPAVTQLFTEHYMVLFLLHNTIGAWHAAKVLAANPDLAENAKDEAELRRAVKLETGGGYEFEYLRFVREQDAGRETEPTALAAGPEAVGDADRPEASAYGSGENERSEPASTALAAGPEAVGDADRPEASAYGSGENERSEPEPTALAAGPEPVRDADGPEASAYGSGEDGPEASAYGSGEDAPEASAYGSGEDAPTGPWRPMGGTFPGWPKTAAELKVLDPSCGSGHFLVAALELLVRLRIHEEGVDPSQAVEAVICDNLFGMEIDPRCTQIAAFNVAMAAWKLIRTEPTALAAGLPSLPPMNNIACSGIPLGNSRDDWMKALKSAPAQPTALAAGCPAEPNSNGPRLAPTAQLSDLGFQWGQLYDMFSQADTLGSLINPQRFFGAGMLSDEQLGQLSTTLTSAIANDPRASSEQLEMAAAAQGLARATELLAGKYTLVVTNVPYLGRGKQDRALKEYLEQQYGLGKADLATAFVLRCLEFCTKGGSTALVTPQNWLFLKTYMKLRQNLLERRQWDFLARLGPGAFETIGGHVVNVALLAITAKDATARQQMAGMDVSNAKEANEKAACLRGEQFAETVLIPQEDQLKNPDCKIILSTSDWGAMLSRLAASFQGIKTGDDERVRRFFWEQAEIADGWKFFQSTVTETKLYGGCERIIDWRDDGYSIARRQGLAAWGKRGVMVSQMDRLPVSLYLGTPFDSNASPIVPKAPHLLPAIWAFCSSEEYPKSVRRIDKSLKPTNTSLVQVPFDQDAMQRNAAERYPNGLPEPESDDPTQWLFHGRPEASTTPLQVAVTRLLGYRWPAELDSEMRLSQRARDLIARCHKFDEFVDDDGIVCIPSVRGEDPAADRLMRLLNSAGIPNPVDLDDWLRNRFFQEHGELFHQRPFIWHIWDGRKDGFSALVNYHKLAGPTGAKLLESLTYSYLGDWITRQEAAVKNDEAGGDARLIAARELQQRLIDILHGEPPFDIFVRWRPLHEQPIGWHPDINDGVRMNIRPFMAADLAGGRKNAGVLRYPPKIKWKKDRGKEPKRPIEDFPWFWSWDEKTQDFQGGDKFTGERWNDLHYTNAVKQAAREVRATRSDA